MHAACRQTKAAALSMHACMHACISAASKKKINLNVLFIIPLFSSCSLLNLCPPHAPIVYYSKDRETGIRRLTKTERETEKNIKKRNKQTDISKN